MPHCTASQPRRLRRRFPHFLQFSSLKCSSNPVIFCVFCIPYWIHKKYESLHYTWIRFRYEGVSESFRTGLLVRELQMVQLSATRCSCTAILWVSLVSFAAITLCVASQRAFIVISLSAQSGNFWIHPRTRNKPVAWYCSCFCPLTTSFWLLFVSGNLHD
jgi:hypothetical protein